MNEIRINQKGFILSILSSVYERYWMSNISEGNNYNLGFRILISK